MELHPQSSNQPRDAAHVPEQHQPLAPPAPIDLSLEAFAERSADPVGVTREDLRPHHASLAGIPSRMRARAEDLRRTHRHLYEEDVTETADGTRRFHDGVLYRREGVNALFLRGSRFEMAFQHGRLLQDMIHQGAIRQSTRMVESNLANTLGNLGSVNSVIAEVIHRRITDRMVAHSLSMIDRGGSGAAMDEALAMGDATGFPVKTLIRALFNPETLLVLAGKTSNSFNQTVNIVAPVSCCSGFAAWGKHTGDGDMLIGRNMDFPLNGFYDRFPTVIYFEPTDGPQRYMTFASAGVHNAGLNAINESGIFIGSHTIPTDRISERGVPIFLTASEVMRSARKLDDAVAIFSRSGFRPPTGWAYLVASIKERKAVAIEFSNTSVAVREAGGEFFVQSNHFLTPQMRKENLFLNQGVVEDNEARYVRMHELISEREGPLRHAEAMEILSDHVDPFSREVCGLGRTLGMHTTMTSVVIDAGKGVAFVANGEGPVSHNTYVSFPLIGTFDREKFREIPVQTVANDGFERAHPEKHRAMKIFIQAKRAHEQENDTASAHALLKQACETDPGNSHYRFQYGIFSLKLGRPSEAVAAFSALLSETTPSPQLERLAHYYRGRAHASLAHRNEALRNFDAVLSDPATDRKLRSAAQFVRRATFATGYYPMFKASLRIMMQQSDMLSY